MWFFWLVVGVVVGYIFKPQLERGVHKAIRYIKDSRGDGSGDDRDDTLN